MQGKLGCCARSWPSSWAQRQRTFTMWSGCANFFVCELPCRALLAMVVMACQRIAWCTCFLVTMG